MTIIHMETEQIQLLATKMDCLAEDIFDSTTTVERGLKFAHWESGSREEILHDIVHCRQNLQRYADEMQGLANAVRREADQWQECASRLEGGLKGLFGLWKPGILDWIRNTGLGGLTGGAFFGAVSAITYFNLPLAGGEGSSSNFYQLRVNDFSYQDLVKESKTLQQEINDLQKQLAALPSLSQVNSDLQVNDEARSQLQDKIDKLDKQLMELNETWRLNDDEANNFLNKILPSKEGGWDSEDGLPWRTRSDDYEDNRAAAMEQINQICQERSNLLEEMARLDSKQDELVVTGQKIEGLQSDLKYVQENKAYVDQLAVAKAPPASIRQGIDGSVPGSFDVPLENQRDIHYLGKQGDYACTPTSLSMITEYYHKVDSSNQAITPLDLIKMQEPDIEGYSMTGPSSFTSFIDDLGEVGYSVDYNSGCSMSDLQSKLEGGPLVALGVMRGDRHAFVVTGMSNGKVSVADPWGGVNRTYTEQQFETIWNGMGNWLVDIHPG